MFRNLHCDTFCNTSMGTFWARAVGLVIALGLTGCGGGGSSTTVSYSGGGLNAQGLSAAVSLPFAQTSNNLPVTVEPKIDGGFSASINTNILYATVTVCVPGTNQCQAVDHVQVDTGSVGLRIMASKLSSLNLPAVVASASPDPVWECYQFVIGGLWGQNAVADVGLGQQVATAVPIQLIQDNPANNVPQAPANCVSWSQNQIMSSPSALGANGILGIGSVTLDCGQNCVTGTYVDGIQYYTCPANATQSSSCASAAVDAAYQTYNPVAALPASYRAGVVIKMPSVTGLGAATASGELILGLNTATNNQVGSLQKIYLGTDPTSHNGDSYLSITTLYNGTYYYNSFLDTGSNGLFFQDATLPTCNSGASFYCPSGDVAKTALVSDGVFPQLSAPITVPFTVGNANALLSTANAAFGSLSGTAPLLPGASVVTTFDWGLPFFYGRTVFQSIWDLQSATGPWYAWQSN